METYVLHTDLFSKMELLDILKRELERTSSKAFKLLMPEFIFEKFFKDDCTDIVSKELAENYGLNYTLHMYHNEKFEQFTITIISTMLCDEDICTDIIVMPTPDVKE